MPYKVETVEIVKSPERMKKNSKKSRHENPLPTKNSRKIMKNNHKKLRSCTFWKTQKETWEKKQTNNSKKEKKNEKTTVEKNNNPNSASKKNKPPTIWQKNNTTTMYEPFLG